MNTVAILSVTITASPEPPTAFRVLMKGVNKTTKGSVRFDDASEKLVMQAYAEHGTDLMIDFEHKSILTAGAPVDGGKAAGWFKPTVRNGELWASDVQWTPRANAALRAREYRYFSPALLHDASGRVHRLVNVALTNLPATQRLQPLMASALASHGLAVEAPTATGPNLGLTAERMAALGVNPAEFLRAYHETRARITAQSTDPAGSYPQKAEDNMSDKELHLQELAAYVALTPEDRGAVALLSAEEIEYCKLFRAHPAGFLAEKRRQAAEAR